MFSTLSDYYSLLIDGLKTYPQLQTAVLTLAGATIMGVVGFLLVKAPKAMAEFIRSQFLTTLVFNTASSGWSEYNNIQYLAFIKWFSKNRWFGWSRTITFDSAGRDEGSSIGPGIGRHFFFYGLRLFIFQISEMDSQGTSNQKYKISLSSIGRSKKPLYAVMEEFMVKQDTENQISVYRSGKERWEWVTYARKRPIETVIMSEELETDLMKEINDFTTSENWYRSRGLNYKKTIMLYGPPGTGKSSLIRAIASMINRDLYIYDLGDDCDMLTMLQQAKGGVVLLEDIDGYSVTRSRAKKKPAMAEAELVVHGSEKLPEAPALSAKGKEDPEARGSFSRMSLPELLNVLDGVVGLDDVIIFITTNHPEKLDGALVRDGRVDAALLVDYLQDMSIRRYIKLFFPDAKIPAELAFHSLPGATVQKLFLQNRHNVNDFIDALLKEELKRPEAVNDEFHLESKVSA